MSIKRILLVGILLLIGVPVLSFVWTNLKAGYDDAERNRSTTHPATTAPAIASGPDARSLAAIDFGKLDFAGNTVNETNRSDHFMADVPPREGGGHNGFVRGMAIPGDFEILGGIESIYGCSWNHLPSASHSGGKVTLELSVQHGTVRAYVQGLNGHRIEGWVYVEASAGKPGQLSGYPVDLSDTGSPEQQFAIQAIGGDATGISYRVYRRE